MMATEIQHKHVQKAFSKAAYTYEAFSGLQRKIGLAMIEDVKTLGPIKRLVDIGMGTGFLTDCLARTFPTAQVVGIDFAQGMVASAKRNYPQLTVIQADACALPLKTHSVDFIFSNATYQWVESLDLAFGDASRILDTKGRMCFTTFGPKTIWELKETFEKFDEGKNARIRFKEFNSNESIEKALRCSGFFGFHIESQEHVLNFKSMFELLRWLKSIGANRGSSQVFFGRQLLDRADDYYRSRFLDTQGIRATFEVLKVFAKKFK